MNNLQLISYVIDMVMPHSIVGQCNSPASVGRFDRQVQCLISSWQFPSRLEPSPDVGPVFPDRRGKPPSRTKT